MIRRRAARLLLVSTAVASLFGCEAGSDHTATPVVVSTDPVVSSPTQGVDAAVVASREVLSVTVAALAAPSSTSTTAPAAPSTTVVVSTTAPAPAPTTTEAPAAEPPSFSANEMQLAPTTTRPPTTTAAAVRVTPPTTAAPAPAPALTPASVGFPLNAAAAADFQSRTNSLRASIGLGPLSRNAQLDSLAAGWARELAAAGKLSHSSSPEAAIAEGWSSAGENVGYGASVASVQDALVASAGHYANLARPSYTVVGIAVAVDAGGRLWVCEVFAG